MIAEFIYGNWRFVVELSMQMVVSHSKLLVLPEGTTGVFQRQCKTWDWVWIKNWQRRKLMAESTGTGILIHLTTKKTTTPLTNESIYKSGNQARWKHHTLRIGTRLRDSFALGSVGTFADQQISWFFHPMKSRWREITRSELWTSKIP